LYHRWYHIIAASLKPGKTLELGGGSGNLIEFFPGVISTDIVFVPWLDAVMDAHELPFKDGNLTNIVLFDVLHHLTEPACFFSEAERVLQPRGRIVFMEPYVSATSLLVYKYLHGEGMAWNVDPWNAPFKGKGGDPFSGNQAIPTLIFEKEQEAFLKRFPALNIIEKEKIDPLVYPLSGGFHNPSLCPAFLWSALSAIERMIKPLNRLLAFRMFVVVEKK
jgi:SAM-dependent methyltransferase